MRRCCGQRGWSKTPGRAWGLERLHRRGALGILEGEVQEAGATQTLASPRQCLEVSSLVFPQSTCCSLSVPLRVIIFRSMQAEFWNNFWLIASIPFSGTGSPMLSTVKEVLSKMSLFLN